MYDNRLITGKLNRWKNFMKKYSLPSYDEIPNLGLYMDQVLTLMNEYLAPLRTADTADTAITAAIINNHVRLKVMPAPEKKKYLRLHIAYLIIICTLKQSMSISDIQKLIPRNLSDDEMRIVYTDYERSYKASVLFFINEVKDETDRILNSAVKNADKKKTAPDATDTQKKALDGTDKENQASDSETKENPDENNEETDNAEFDHAVKSLIFSSATIASFAKLLTSKVVNLGDVQYSEELVSEREI